MVVLNHEGDVGTAEIFDRQLGGVAHRDADLAWSAVLGQRQDHADANRSGAQRLADERRPGRGRRR